MNDQPLNQPAQPLQPTSPTQPVQAANATAPAQPPMFSMSGYYMPGRTAFSQKYGQLSVTSSTISFTAKSGQTILQCAPSDLQSVRITRWGFCELKLKAGNVYKLNLNGVMLWRVYLVIALAIISAAIHSPDSPQKADASLIASDLLRFFATVVTFAVLTVLVVKPSMAAKKQREVLKAQLTQLGVPVTV